MLIPFLAAALTLASPARAAEKKTPSEAIVDREWKKTEKSDKLYGQRITPPFPAAWPPVGDGKVANIVYSAGWGQGLSDGEFIGSAWGRIISKPGSDDVSFTRLAPATKLLGTQGVQPMTRAEIAVYDAQAKVFESIETVARSKGAPQKVDPGVRAYYCQWRHFDGVIAEKLPAAESDFLRWLECDKRVSSGAAADEKEAVALALKNLRYVSGGFRSWVEEKKPYRTTARALSPKELADKVQQLASEADPWLRDQYAKAQPGDIWTVHLEAAEAEKTVDVVVNLNGGGELETSENPE